MKQKHTGFWGGIKSNQKCPLSKTVQTLLTEKYLHWCLINTLGSKNNASSPALALLSCPFMHHDWCFSVQISGPMVLHDKISERRRLH